MKAVAIIQARMTSTRLPGKVLADLGGRPLLARVVERARLARTLAEVVVATTVNTTDDPVAALCASLGLPCFRGSEEDVLDRYHGAAGAHGADPVVRITADCPLLDPAVVDRVMGAYIEGGCDYASNTLHRSYPDGLDTEVFSYAALDTAWREARLASEREHVTPFIWKNPARFRIRQVVQPRDLSALRWTVDEPADLAFVRQVQALLPEGATSMEAILEVLAAHPELAGLNANVKMNQGYRKSLQNDHPIR
jgi:spore coat polysaccharide biosynthesis protein SpsF (cytidylyltransferase family)